MIGVTYFTVYKSWRKCTIRLLKDDALLWVETENGERLAMGPVHITTIQKMVNYALGSGANEIRHEYAIDFNDVISGLPA
jgi:hypothetical protein